MKLWKSPILYFGLLLVLLVAGALVAPFVIDWNSYRSNLEAYGQKLTGRKVTVNGPITVRLFPWPRLEANDLRLDNPAGRDATPMFRAGKMTSDFALAGLASGQIKVERIAFDHPVMNLQLDEQGNGNWHFKPDLTLQQGKLLAGVQLDEIVFSKGEINIIDARHGWQRQVRNVAGQLSGAALEGPWKAKASGLYGEVPVEFSFSTLAPKVGEPLGFAARIVPQDGSWPVLGFEGKGSSNDFEGRVTLEPVITQSGKSSVTGFFKPLSYAAKVAVKGEQVDLSAIHIVAADSADAGTLIEGDGHVDLTQGFKAQVNLSAPHVDVDALGGDGLWRLSETGGVMAALNGVIQQFPQTLNITGNLNATVLTLGGEKLQNVSLKTTAAAGGVRVQELTADLPGLSRLKFSGLIFPGPKAAELGGKIAFETGDSRALAGWLWPGAKESWVKLWTGQRGRLKGDGDIAWGGRAFGLQNLRYELDGLPGSGNFAISFGATPSFDVQLATSDFDLGAYVPGGFSPVGLVSSFSGLLPGETGFQKKLDLNFGRLSLNGVLAQNVVVVLNTSASGFEIKRLDIGAVEGAELRGNGLVLMQSDGPSGEVKFAVGAPRPQGLLRLLGLFPKGQDPAWAQNLGQTHVLADIVVKPGKREPQITGSLTGSAGAMKIIGTGTATELSAKEGPNFGLSGTLNSPDARDVLRLLALPTSGAEAGDGQLALTFQGRIGGPMRTVLDFEGLGASMIYDGTLTAGKPFSGVAGTLKIDGAKGGSLLQAFGSPLKVPGPFKLDLALQPEGEGLRIGAIAALIGDQALKGSGLVSARNELRLDLTGGTMRLADLAVLALAPWNGASTFPSGRFGAGWPMGLTGEINLAPAELIDPLGMELLKPRIKLLASADERRFSIVGDSGNQLDAKLQQKGAAFAVDGTLAYSVPLARLFAFATKPAALAGDAVYRGSFSAEGYSPLAVLRALAGTGNLALNGMKVNGLDPDPFYAAAVAAKSNEELTKSFAGLAKGAGVGFSPQTVKCDLKDGALRCEPLRAETQEALVSVMPTADVAEGTASAEVTVSAKGDRSLPPLRLLLSGVPGAMGERLDAAALSAKLGTALVNKDMEELARLQKEQQRIESENAKQSEDDRAKYDAFQAQRTELRLQARMIKVFQQQRAMDAARAKAALDAAVNYGLSIQKEEKRRLAPKAMSQ